jgi:N-acetylglucosamine kinase-like BadF-type ATPase
MNRPALLGVDGGGTSTICWLADERGDILGRGQAGPSNAKAEGPEAARRALDESVDRAFADAGLARASVGVACLGLAGFDRPDDRALLRAWAEPWAHELLLVNDGELVLAAGTPKGWGVAIIAGTGSIAVGRAADGRTARAGGWGHIFGDEGSAYGVATEALRLVARSADGRCPLDPADRPLIDAICRAWGVAEPAGLVTVVYAPGVDRPQIAATGPAVAEAAASGSPAAKALLKRAAAELASAARAVASELKFKSFVDGERLPLALAGSFLLNTPRLIDSVAEDLFWWPIVTTCVTEPVRGAIVLARRALLKS